MIREFKCEDTAAILEILNKDNIRDEGDISDNIQAPDKKMFVYDASGIKGFSYIKISDKETKKCTVILYVEPATRRKGVGTLLYQEVINYLNEINPNFLLTESKIGKEDFKAFYRKLGYNKWYGCHKLVYKGNLQPATNLEFIPYTDEYYEQYAKCRQECFYDLRKENDIQPYRLYQNTNEKDPYIEKSNESRYLALDNGQIIASFEVDNGYIDAIIVPPALQGRGYGKKTTQAAISKAQCQNAQLISLMVMESNIKAINMYKSLGFEIIETTHVYRRFWDKGLKS